jgi:hypothetical protein
VDYSYSAAELRSRGALWPSFALALAQHNAQVFDHRFETVIIDPATHLLINNLPRRKIVGQYAPVAADLTSTLILR